jgi:transglutaminase-like putative cysteine protease
VTADDTWVKVLTEKGKRDEPRLSFHFNAHYGGVEVAVVELHKPDGTVVAVDVPAQSRVMVDRSQAGLNIFDPQQKILEVGVPGLEVYDVLHYRFVRRHTKTRMPEAWSDYQVFEYTSPIKHCVYEVDGPAALPLRSIALKDEVEGTMMYRREATGDRVLHRWEVRDVPRMYREPAMPPLHTVVQRLLVSTLADWEEISRWYWSISAPHLAPTEGMKAKVAELTEGIETRRGRIEAIFRYVSQEIRYMGITTETEAPGYEPHDVRITFENKYGVCRDKAALLVAMLRVGGFEAYPVLIHNGPKKDPDVPQPYFNHAITCVKEPDGGTLLMDATDETTRRLLPAYLCNQSYLVAHPEGETLRTSPIVPAGENMMRIATTGALDADGGLTLACDLHFEGVNDNAYRGYLSRIRPAQRREFFEGVARRVVAGGRLARLDIAPDDLQDTAVPLRVRMEIEAEAVTVGDGGTLMLPVPSMGARVGLVNFLLREAKLEERDYPFVTKIACGVEETLDLDVGALVGETLTLPRYAAVDTEAITFTRGLAREGDALKGASDFRLEVVEFSPEAYLVLKETLRKMELNDRKRPIFGARGDEADVRVLEHVVNYELHDRRTWEETHHVRKKILTYAGKKREAELKLDYNPAWEELEVTQARVRSPDGALKTVRAEEMNTLDAAWAGSAPRYPAGKTLVISFPNVEIGSVIEYAYVLRKSDQPFFAAREYFNDFDPVRRKWVTLAIPEALRDRMKLIEPPEVKRSHAGVFVADGMLHGEWTAARLPSVEHEPNLPPWWAFNPTLFISTTAWPDYAATVHAALKAAAEGQPACEGRARRLVAGVAGEAAKVRALRDFVARNVRPAGPALHRLPLSAVTPADDTLRDGYGNSADRAVLLYAMLRAAGFAPEYVLASGATDVAGVTHPLLKAPHPRDFGSVLVRVRPNGDRVYLNDTDQYARLGVTPHDGHYGLALPSGEVFVISATEAHRDRAESITSLELLADGDARLTKTTLHYGNVYTAFRRRFSEMRPEERRRYHQELVADVAQSAEADGPLVTNYDRYPGTETFTVTVRDYAVRDGAYYYFTVPNALRELFDLRAASREHPLLRARPRRVSAVVNVTLPEGVGAVVLDPPPVHGELPGGRVRASVLPTDRMTRASGGGASREITLLEEARLAPALIHPKDYGRLLDLQRALRHPKARTLLLEMRGE